jgi:MscS family membrane protein
MKAMFEKVHAGLVIFFAVAIVSSLWAGAQTSPATNVTREDAAPRGSGLLREIEIRKAYLTFGLDHVPFLAEKKIAGYPLAQYLATFLYIFLAFQVSRCLGFLTRVYLKRWAEKTETKFDDLLLAVINGPVRIISFVGILYIGLQVFEWSSWVESLIQKGLTVILAISLTYMTMRMVDVLSREWIRRLFKEQDKGFQDHLLPIVRQSLRVFVVVIAVLLTTQNLGLNVTALIGSLGVAGLALSLASKDTLENFFGAVAVFVDRPFKVGDRINLDDVDGTVELIGLRSTRVRSLDGYLITIPNKTMGNATITNITARPSIKTVTNIGIAYDTPVGRVKQAVEILEGVYKAHRMTADLIVSFDRFADSSLNILVVHWWGATDQKEYLAGMQEMNLEIKQQFEKAGISFAFPSRTVYLKQDSDWRLAATSGGAR